MDAPTTAPIVVGVDGSPSSKAALRWALRQAQLTGAALHAVISWEVPAFSSWEGGPIPPDDYEQAAHTLLDETVDELVSEPGQPRVVRHVRRGYSARVLLDAAAEASLLVVGSRGHGSFYGALLGSVSQHCAIHAHCPVVIVRGC